MKIPEKCPKCGVEGSVERTGRFFHCTDYHCGSAWPAEKPKRGNKPGKKRGG